MQKGSWVIAVFLAFCTWIGPASAQSLTFQFDQAVLVGAPGDTLTFQAAVSNPSSSLSSVYLNSSDVSLSGPEPIAPLLDISDYFINFAFASPLVPGQEVSGSIMEAAIDPMTTPGDYTGVFSILGGSDPNASVVLASQNFTITVVPEPSSPMLCIGLCIGTVGVAALKSRGRKI